MRKKKYGLTSCTYDKMYVVTGLTLLIVLGAAASSWAQAPVDVAYSDFSSVSDHPTQWVGDWTDSPGSCSGCVTIPYQSMTDPVHIHMLRIRMSANYTRAAAERGVDLTNYYTSPAPTITFSYKTEGLWSQDVFSSECSPNNGGTWYTLTPAQGSNVAWTDVTNYPIPSTCLTSPSTFKIRFIVHGNRSGGTGYVDDVYIRAVPRGPTTSTSTTTTTTVGPTTTTTTTIGPSTTTTTIPTTTTTVGPTTTTTVGPTTSTTTTTIPGGTTTTTTVGSTTTTTPCGPMTTTTIPVFTGSMDMHTFPTFLFIASYDWLHNFYDYNAQGTRGANQTDPDTDNFNKIITIDSNLFPIMTAVAGDHEFPNITSRNTTTWLTTSPSPFSPSVNDYFNRSIAVVPDYISQSNLNFTIFSSVCGGDYLYSSRPIIQYGGRSLMQWAFITDPGNHNIRRYEFKKLGEYFSGFDGDDGVVLGANPGEDATSVCNQAYGAWAMGDTYQVLGGEASTQCSQKPWPEISPEITAGSCVGLCTNPGTYPFGCYENEKALWTCKHGDAPLNDGGEGETPTGNYTNGGGSVSQTLTTATELANYLSAGNYYDHLELPIQEIPEWTSGSYTFPVTLCGNARENSSDIFAIGVNTKYQDPPHTGGYAPVSDFYVQSGWQKMINTGFYRDCKVYTITLNENHDLDTGEPGLQFRLRLYAMGQGGFVLDEITVGSQDSGFAVKQDPAAGPESRWNNISTFLALVPPESYPGYQSFTSGLGRTLGYGSTTNTSFDTARNVHFKDPRDIDVYRDFFDVQNGAPVYIFVADTMNSRIQVFMNATGSAGVTGAEFPIRPVRVKAPTDLETTNSVTAYNSNELAMRIYSTTSAGVRESVRFGDGRRADWRQYTTVPGDTFVNISAGKGEFYFPHGIAVDQDPDTKDVYLFVADTYNHRIQVFRDLSGVSSQPIDDKRFDFQFVKGWGTYPIYSAIPGGYNFKYPKGLDIARFANNSSYLYVVDSKDYRVLKYLISENGNGLNDPQIAAGYGYDGSSFVSNLTSIRGVPLSAHGSFKQSGLAAVGFLNPQDVTTGYSGFYTYSTMSNNSPQYRYEIPREDDPTLKQGIQYLNDYMVYVTDYARNNTSVTTDRLNMRVVQFADNLPYSGDNVYLPWETKTVNVFDTGSLGQSVFGVYSGSYNSTPGAVGTGSSGNVPGVRDRFTDRPVGIAALTWDTVTPFDMRVLHTDPTPENSTVYPNGTTIPINTELRVGVVAHRFFDFPYSDPMTYLNYSSSRLGLDGKGVKQVHVFCYNSTGAFVGYMALPSPPFRFVPSQSPLSCVANGYMKIIAEDKHFKYSGKTGTMIFKIGN
jgi:hypothetical protein